jgi:hypothetical protein
VCGMRKLRLVASVPGAPLLVALACAAQSPATVHVDWSHPIGTTKTTITLQVVENPPLRRGSAIHDAAWANLTALETDNTRLALWYPYPHLAVAELSPPTATATSWDFRAIDPIVEDFFHATVDHDSVFTMSTLPTWMFCDAPAAPIPASPDEPMWSYEAGVKLCDPSGRQAAAYFARIAGWYTRGGFVDERGKWHASGHHERIGWWEVLNEPEYEHALDIRTYTRLYDSITAAVHAVSPTTKFVGMSLAEPMRSPDAFEHFLNPANHAPHTPLDAISFHFYADAESGETDATETYSFFAQADAFLNSVRFIQTIRNRLAPDTGIQINEAGCISASDLNREPDKAPPAFDSPYWNLCGAVFAYLYTGLSSEGIDVLGASQLVGYPTQFPSVSLLNWDTGQPNARYRVLELLHNHFGPGDTRVAASTTAQGVVAAGFVHHGRRTLILINKRPQPVALRLENWQGADEEHVDLGSEIAIRRHSLDSADLQLDGYGVMIVTYAP